MDLRPCASLTRMTPQLHVFAHNGRLDGIYLTTVRRAGHPGIIDLDQSKRFYPRAVRRNMIGASGVTNV